jgi:(6-4)DNA photolyase
MAQKKEKKAVVIFPHQLFKKSPVIEPKSMIFLVEAPRYFNEFNFHKKKLVLHRASMKAYENYLKEKGFTVHYIPFNKYESLFQQLKKKKFTELHYIDPVDISFEDKFITKLNRAIQEIICYETPAFLSSIEWLESVFKKSDHYRMYPFYVKQRKRLDILLTKSGDPIGGKWSFDKENRQPLPKNIEIPEIWQPEPNEFIEEALIYVDKYFGKNPGTTENFLYPINFTDAQSWLNDFLKKRFEFFGAYQDAILIDDDFLFHSVLSPLLNIGLLTPEDVINKALAYADKHKTPINSVEGFARQIIGWREFVRAVYIFEEKKQRRKNYFRNNRKLPKSFWEATTDIKPIDDTINKVLDIAYVHHIERLMVLGNFMLLCEFKPNEVYKWFMELFIDAYDWVMVPNVYGMSQFADGGLMTTKPYLSSSNYICNMSNYSKNEWSTIWDALYWHFLHKYQKKLKTIPRMQMNYFVFDKMDKNTLNKHLKIARSFLKSLEK